MIVYRRIPLRLILRVEWKQILFFIALTAAVFVVHRKTELDLSLPLSVVATIGTAVAVLLGFKNNAAYQRWWEGRKLWGSITNASRHFVAQLLGFLDFTVDEAEDRDAVLGDLVNRHLAFVNVLRCQLRQQPTDEELAKWLSAGESAALKGGRNKATLILTRQTERLRELREKKMIDEWRFFPLLGTIGALFDAQGGAERLDNTPLMRHYAYFTTAFVWIFVVLLPFGFASVLNWMTFPLIVLISTVFTMLDRAGTFTEDPFDDDFNDVPISTICRSIEIDMKQQVGIEPVPPPLEPIDGVLM